MYKLDEDEGGMSLVAYKAQSTGHMEHITDCVMKSPSVC